MQPSNNTFLYSYWQSNTDSSKYAIDSKIEKNYEPPVSFTVKKLKEEIKVEKIATVSSGIDRYLENLLIISKQAKNVDDESLEEVSKLLEKYSKARIGNDGTGYWINYCYGYVHNSAFNPSDSTQINVYNQIVSTVEEKWLIQANLGAQLVEKLDNFVVQFCFGEQHSLDLKNVLLHFESAFASKFVNPAILAEGQTLHDYYSTFCGNHLNEYRILIDKVGQKLNGASLNYSDNDIYLSNNYYSVSSKTLSDFIASTDKSSYINSLTNQKAKAVLQILYNSYLGGC